MIAPAYVVEMARYNAWQNKQIMGVVDVVDVSELTKERGAFFGSVFATLNHLLWGDTLWMSRFCSDVALPSVPGSQSVSYMATVGEWQAERFRLDGRMRIWGETLSNLDLAGDLVWHYTATGEEKRQPLWMCVTHMFNHQTHHRGQVHAMLTAAGVDAPVTDLCFMPEDV